MRRFFKITPYCWGRNALPTPTLSKSLMTLPSSRPSAVIWGVFPFEPLPAIYCVVTRMTPEGSPAGGWYPAGRISVEAALRHFTRDGAYASFDEEIRGALTTGKLADFVVLSKDILTAPPAEILNTKVLLTVMGGKDTYRSADFR